MTKDEFIELIKQISDTIIENKDYLTELDRPIGDNDHGINMARGFKAVEDKLDSLKDKDIGTILKQIGITLVSQVGGSAGPLYGTAFMNAGKVMDQKQSIDLNDFEKIIATAIDGVKLRGKAELGEATMLDAIIPCHQELQKQIADNADIKTCLSNCLNKTIAGADSTIPMIAKKGRASYVGERGIGHKDPGATSFSLIIEVISNFAGK